MNWEWVPRLSNSHMLVITAFLFALCRAVDYRFSDIAVYGLDRCIASGVGPSSYNIMIESPLRKSARDNNLAMAKVYITDNGNIRAEYSHGAIVGVIRDRNLIFPEDMKNNDSLLSRSGMADTRVTGARTGDTVVVFVPHTSSPKAIRVTRARFYKNFKGRDHGSEDLPDLVNRFMDLHFTDNRETRRFTLLVANVRRVDNAISRRYRVISDPNERFGSDDSDEFGSPGTSSTFASLSYAPTNIPISQVSQGLPISSQQRSGHTSVISAPLIGQQQANLFNTQQPSSTISFSTVQGPFQGQPINPSTRQGSRRK